MNGYGTNNYGSRSFLLSVAATMFSFLVDDSTVDNGVILPSGAAEKLGRGVIQEDGVAGQAYSLQQLGNTLVRKTGVIAQGDLLTTSATVGALCTAKPGEPIYGEALFASLAADNYVPCNLIPGGGSLTVPRTSILTVLTVSADGLLLTIPADYRLDSLVAHNETANAVTIKAGKTAGTQTIIAPAAVSASTYLDTTLILKYFSRTVDQAVYISSADWNGASLTINAQLTYMG